MNIEIKEIESTKFMDTLTSNVLILGHNYLSDTDYEYHSTTLSFYKYSKDKLPINYLTEPKLLLEQRSIEWFAPVLLLTSAALSENTELISITCGVIGNYLTDFFKGQKKPNVRVKLLYTETKTSKITEFSYEGQLDGLDKLKESILQIASRGSVNE